MLNNLKMSIQSLRAYLLVLLCFSGCECGNNNNNQSDPFTQIPTKAYLNLEAIDLGSKATEDLSFEYNGKKLSKEGSLFISEDLIIYPSQSGNWRATVIGPEGVSSQLKISNHRGLVKKVGITTTSEVVKYEAALGPEWPGMYNIGNTCYANAAYKLIARCSGFDEVLKQDKKGEIPTSLRNIVNGIRLGKKSAMQEELVNKRVSELFLRKLNERTANKYPIGQQRDARSLLEQISKLLYPTAPQIINQSVLSELLSQLKAEHPPFKRITKRWISNTVFQFDGLPKTLDVSHLKAEQDSDQKHLSLPQFYLYVASGGDLKKEILATFQVPIWDAGSKQIVEEKTYRIIAFLYHQGTEISGHYLAYVNFGVHGWYQHNDSSVSSAAFLKSIKSNVVVGLYECVD